MISIFNVKGTFDMPNDLSVYDRFDDAGQMIERLGQAIMMSEMFGCSNASQGQVLALECAARKMPPMSLAERYHIIGGRLSMKADAMLADFRGKCGGSHRIISRTADVAEIELTINGESQRFRLSWDDAKCEPFVYKGGEAATLDNLAKGNHRALAIKAKYQTPRSRAQMMWARVVSDGVRAMAPEVVSGTYTPEEIDDFADADGDAIVSTVVETPPFEPTSTNAPVAAANTPTGGVSLSGVSTTLTPFSQTSEDRCGDVMANEIKARAQSVEMPPEKLIEIVGRYGVNTIADMPHSAAEKLLSKLSQMETGNVF